MALNRITTFVAAASMAVAGAAAHAGGPVVIEEEVEVVAEKPASSIGILPLLLIGIVLCVALCGGDDDEPEPTNGIAF
jgi:hypothetical protein